MSRWIACCAVAVAGVALAGCGSGATGPVVTETVTVQASAPPAEPVPVESARSEILSAPAEPTLMPDVTCLNLQVAQDTIQAAGVFFSRSADASGEGRRQVIDSNWVVVSQKPAAGEPVTEAESVLSVVKEGEPGDCS